MLLSRLSASFSNRWVHLHTVSRQIFGDIQETQFSGSKNGCLRSSEKCFPSGIGNRRIEFGYNLWFASHPSSGQPIWTSLQERDQKIFLFESDTAKSLGNSKISRNSKISVRTRFEQQNLLVSFLKRGTYRLPWSAEAALQGLLTSSKFDRTWLPGAALLTPILKGATLWGQTNFGPAHTKEPPGHKPLVVNVVVVGSFEEEEEGKRESRRDQCSQRRS